MLVAVGHTPLVIVPEKTCYFEPPVSWPLGRSFLHQHYITFYNTPYLTCVWRLGAITGSMTSGAALSIVNREAGNSLPALGYTGAYAFANVLLTVAGSIILLL